MITATNRNLEERVEQGGFRRDLFYRLNVFPIFLPPLRQHPEDVLPLANHFIRRYAQAENRKNARRSHSVMDMLQRYAWPGNIRELGNVMERAALLGGREGLILPQHLPPALHALTSWSVPVLWKPWSRAPARSTTPRRVLAVPSASCPCA